MIEFAFLSYTNFFFFFVQKTAYEVRISDWSSDVCSSYLRIGRDAKKGAPGDQVDPALARRFAQPHLGFGIERHDRAFGKRDGRRLAGAGAEMLRLCRAEARENAHIGGPSEPEDPPTRRPHPQMPAPPPNHAFDFPPPVC